MVLYKARNYLVKLKRKIRCLVNYYCYKVLSLLFQFPARKQNKACNQQINWKPPRREVTVAAHSSPALVGSAGGRCFEGPECSGFPSASSCEGPKSQPDCCWSELLLMWGCHKELEAALWTYYNIKRTPPCTELKAKSLSKTDDLSVV